MLYCNNFYFNVEKSFFFILLLSCGLESLIIIGGVDLVYIGDGGKNLKFTVPEYYWGTGNNRQAKNLEIYYKIYPKEDTYYTNLPYRNFNDTLKSDKDYLKNILNNPQALKSRGFYKLVFNKNDAFKASFSLKDFRNKEIDFEINFDELDSRKQPRFIAKSNTTLENYELYRIKNPNNNRDDYLKFENLLNKNSIEIGNNEKDIDLQNGLFSNDFFQGNGRYNIVVFVMVTGESPLEEDVMSPLVYIGFITL